MREKNLKIQLLPEEMEEVYVEYGRTRRFYEEYQKMRKQLGKKASEIMNIEEMEENLKSLGARRYA
jgi:hypothetical protein